jgi:hypothetical protein
MAIPFAGNWDPKAFREVFSGGSQGFYGPQKDPYEELLKQLPSQPALDPSKLGETGQIVAAAMNPNPQNLILQARLQEIGTQRASELSRQNIDYAVRQQRKYESERDKERFKYGMMARIPELIGEAFAAPGRYALLGSQMGTQSLANVLNTPSASFATVPFQPQRYLS